MFTLAQALPPEMRSVYAELPKGFPLSIPYDLGELTKL